MSILFSYETPVAGWDDKGAFRTEQKFSATTSKHINKYLGGKDIGRTVKQSYISGLVEFMASPQKINHIHKEGTA